jgi:epoxyqueuosine reductase
MMIDKIEMKKIMNALMVEHWGILTIDADQLPKLIEREQYIREILLKRGTKEFEQDLDKRFLFSSDKKIGTIIAIGIPYDPIGSALPNAFGLVDNFAWEHDYHEILRNLLNAIHTEIGKSLSGPIIAPEVCVDTADYIDREIGLYTGLGKIGKNHFLIHPEMGTHFFIGYLIYDGILDINPAEINRFDFENTLLEACEGCNRCSSACPTKICGGPIMDSDKCIAMLTQTKRVLNDQEREWIGNCLYGCNICQKVCPMNKGLSAHPYLATKTENQIDLYELLGMNNKTFMEKYGKMGFSWRSLWVYKRNALIILGNHGNRFDLEMLNTKTDLLKNPKLEATFLWAVGRLESRQT